MTDERRGSPRHVASLAGELEAPSGKTQIAITRDVAANGLMLFTRLRDEECTGTVRLKVMHDGEELFLNGTIVRSEPVEDSTLWRNKIAIAVDPNDPTLVKLFAAIATAS